jgi:hypothetical protein
LIRHLVPALGALMVTSCGYHIAGHSSANTALPANIRTIAVPAFSNATTRYKLSDRLPGAITREFITRTRYRVVSDESEADAILRGGVLNFLMFPNVIDQAGRATAVQVIVYLQLTLHERASGKVLYSRPNMEIRQNYEIAIDPKAYLDESDLASDRLSIEVARSVVSAVLEAF